jgi:hypothetical protein
MAVIAPKTFVRCDARIMRAGRCSLRGVSKSRDDRRIVAAPVPGPAVLQYARSVVRTTREPTIVLAALVALASVTSLWQLGQRSPAIDFYQFWVAAQVLAGPGARAARLYDAREQTEIATRFRARAAATPAAPRLQAAATTRSRLELYGSPFLYAAFVPLVTGDYETDHRRFRLLSLAALVVAILTLGHVLGHSPSVTLLVLAFVALAFQPLRADIRVGNLNQIQLLLLAAYLWLASRERSRLRLIAAGAVLGLSVTLKPNVAAVVPLLAVAWLVAGRTRRLVLEGCGVLAGLLGAVLVGASMFGALSIWARWLGAVRALPGSIIPVGRGNFGISRLALEHLGVDVVPLLATTTFAVTVAAVCYGRHRLRELARASGGGEIVAVDALVVGTGCLLFLLSAPLVWQHYFVLVLPSVMVLLGPPGVPRPTRTRLVLTAAAFVAVAITPYADLLGIGSLDAQAVVVDGGLVLLFATSLRALAGRPGRGSVPSQKFVA